MRTKLAIAFTLAVLLLLPFIVFFTQRNFSFDSKASPGRPTVTVNANRILNVMPDTWRALAQGGEEKGTRMLENVIPQVAELYPRYIRIDHIFDFYNVVQRAPNGQLIMNWTELDATVCDIYHTGAKPFLSLGYMPETLSGDTTLVSLPKKWEEWVYIVQKTVEHYSGKKTILCGNLTGNQLADTYYEVWNEPDGFNFGAWSIWGGDKDYNLLYYYSSIGAQRAQNVNNFALGGPSTTHLNKVWLQRFLDFATINNERVDFISWHHYSHRTDDFTNDMVNIRSWLSAPEYKRYSLLPKLITEWGYDSEPNPIADTEIGAAHSVASISNLIEQNLSMAFAFEIKDGLQPSWGMLTREGEQKPRYKALRLLNNLERYQLQTINENTNTKSIGSYSAGKYSVVLTNYDPQNTKQEIIKLRFNGVPINTYDIVKTGVDGEISRMSKVYINNNYEETVYLQPNEVLSFQLIRNK